MLVLSRKRNEKILITVPASNVAQEIELLIIEIRGDKARVGLQADRSITIHRQEVADAIAREKESGIQ